MLKASKFCKHRLEYLQSKGEPNAHQVRNETGCLGTRR